MNRIVTSFLRAIFSSKKTTYQNPPVNKYKGPPGTKYMIFIVRAVFSAVFAVLICKIFRPEAQPGFIAGLGIFLLGTSYAFEYYRKKKTDD
jgi:hypothetical protein